MATFTIQAGSQPASGPPVSSLTDAQKQDLEKIAILEATITGSVQELTPGETIQRIGSNRLYSVGGVKMLLAFNGASAPYVVPNPITVADLAKWAVTSQYPATATNFPANAIVPAGFQLQYQGSIRRHTATRMTGAAIDLANWEVEVPSTATIDDWIKNAGDDHAAGEKLFKADDRRIEVAGVGVRMTYRGADIDSCPAMSLAEIANWEYVSQAITPTAYPASALAPKGFRYRRNESSQLLQLKANTLLPATYDAAQWEAVSGANIRVLNGTNFDILTALSIVETEGVFNRVPQLSNGPNNSAQNVSGYWRVIGDSKNGLIMLTILDGDSVNRIGGDWTLRVSTDAQNVTTTGSWQKLIPGGAYKASSNGLKLYTPEKVYWNLSHNLNLNFVGDGPISLLPMGDWSERTGTITTTGGTTLFGQFPLSGSDEIELHYDPATLRYNIREASSSNRASTVHNSGLTTSIALKGSTHHMAEVHVEGGKDYTIAAADWADGQWFRLVQTAGTNTTEKLLPSGFAGAFLRDSKSSNIAAGLEIGQRDAQFLCTITNNGGSKFLNVSDRTALATRVATAETAIASAIANWASDRQYKTDQITIRNKTFFLCLKDNIGHDPLTDTGGNWSVFNPGSSSDMFANRSPVATDVQPVGTKWWDVSFGADTPLGFVSLGNGAWQFLNQISLSKIRFFGYGINSTYQSNLNSIKFFKADDTQIPNGWFVWGASSGLGKPTAGTAFSGQNITAGYNASGWADLEPSSLFDLSVNITKITASSGYFTFTKLQLIYDNGGIKTFSALGDLSPVPQSRYGDSIAAALGETLTAVKLSDANSTDPGRLTGEAFVSAWNILYQAQPKTTPTVHNFGVTADIPLTGALHDGAEAHIENGADYTIDAADWEDGQSLSFIHTAGSVTPEELKLTGFTRAYYRDGKSTEIVASLAIGTIIDANYKATITDNGGFKFFNIWIENDGITGSAGIAHAYLNATDRAAGTGYTPTAADVTEANLFLELGTNTLWRCTDDNPLTWAQVSGDSVPELTDAQVKDSTSNVFGTVSGKRLTDAIRSKTEQVNAQFSTGTTIDATTVGLVKNQRLYLYSSTGAPAQLKVRFNDTFTKTVSVNGATGTTVGNVVTIENVRSAFVYQEFAEAGTVGGVTRIVCSTGTAPAFSWVDTDATLASWQASAKAGDIAEDTRAGTIYESRGSGGALRLTPNWIDRMDYTVTAATSIADGLVAGSLISGMNGVAFLRGSRDRKAIIKQATAITLGALRTAVNTALTTATLATTDIAYRRSISAGWVYFDGTDPDDATIVVPAGWYVVSVNGTDLNIEPLATHVSQIVYHTGATPDAPANIGMPALAVNTATGGLTHWWRTNTLSWVSISTPPQTPIPVNYAIDTTVPTYFTPVNAVANGGFIDTVSSTITIPPTCTDFLIPSGSNRSGFAMELPVSPTPGRRINVRNEAADVASVINAGTGLSDFLDLPQGRSAHFLADAAGVWQWQPAPSASAATAELPASSVNDYIHVHATGDQTTGLTVGSPVLFSSPTVQNSAGCSFSGGVFTLPANKTFRLESQITWATGTEVIVRWRNITANTLIGGSANALVSGRGCIASAVISTTQVTTVKLEIIYVDGFTGFYAGTGRGSWAYIEEITRSVFTAPTNTTLFTPRNITGTGITTTQGRDNTVSTIAVTGILAGSEVTAVTRTGNSTVRIKDSGRNGTAYIDVIPNGADTELTVSQTVWRRTVTATANSTTVNVNGAASTTVDATAGAVTVALTLPANNEMTGVTATNAAVTGFSTSGGVTLIPNNNGNIVLTPTFTPVTKATAQHVANAGTALNCGSIRLRMNTAANRGLQIQSNTGANLTWRSMSNWEGGGSTMFTGTATTSGWASLCDFNFTAVSQFQNSIIWDETNNRKYLVFYTVQSSFNSSPMMITEL